MVNRAQHLTVGAVIRPKPFAAEGELSRESNFMPKKKKEEVPAESNTFWCCEHPSTEMTHEQMLKHLKVAHKFNTNGLKGEKRMVCHIDGREWFSYDYEITIKQGKKTVKLMNNVVCHRSDDDMMRWA